MHLEECPSMGILICLISAMIVIGVVYNNDCPYSQATLFLQVYGGVIFGASFNKIFFYFMKHKYDLMDKIIPALDLAEFIIIIWGSIVVFSTYYVLRNYQFPQYCNCHSLISFSGAYSDVNHDDPTSEMYCHTTPFYMAFINLIFQWIMIPFKICCACCICCGICCAATAIAASASNNQQWNSNTQCDTQTEEIA